MVSRWRMCVCSHHKTGAAIAEVPHGHLLGTGLGVEINQNGITVTTQLASFKLAVHGRKRIIEHGLNHHPPHRLHHKHTPPGSRLNHGRSQPRATCRPVDRADHALLARNKHQCLTLVKGMVAQRHHVSARFAQRWRDATPKVRVEARQAAMLSGAEFKALVEAAQAEGPVAISMSQVQIVEK